MSCLPVNELFQSVLRYDPPVAISDHDETPVDKSTLTTLLKTQTFHDIDSKEAKDLPNEKNKIHTREVLYRIFPPKVWEEDGEIYRQEVSSEPATCDDVTQLEEQLDLTLTQNRTRSIGFCLKRSTIMNRFFDEIVRQETVDCSERGILMKRVKGEYDRRLEAYERLVDATFIFGKQKMLQGGESDLRMKSEIADLEKQVKELEARKADLEDMAEQRRSRAKELREATQHNRAEELNTIHKNLEVLEAYMDRLMNMDAYDK